jgi:FkbM family methyltransferase
MKTRIRRAIQVLTGRVYPIRTSVRVDKAFYGDAGGGFFAAPGFLGPDSVVCSLGIGENATFDQAIIARNGCRVFGFDPTPKSIAWVARQEGLRDRFAFFPFGIAASTGPAELFLPKDDRYVSGSLLKQDWVDGSRGVTVEMKSWPDIVAAMGAPRVDILKMDIEGAEYLVLDSILAGPVPVGQILVEFHDRLFRDGKARTREAVAKLKARGYGIFAVSPSGEEVSFISAPLVSRAGTEGPT